RVDAFAVGGAIGGVAAGAAIAIATIGGSTTAMIGDSCGGACTAQVSIGLAGDEVHNVSVTAQSDDTVSSKTLAVAAGAISLSGAVAYSKVDPAVSATIANTDFLVTGDVTVLAYSQDHVKSQSYGANIGAVALGAAVSLATSDPTTTASLTTTTNVEAGGVITVEARHDHDGASALAGEGAVAEVTAGSGGGLVAGSGAGATAGAGGLFAGSGAITNATANGTTTARVGSTLYARSFTRQTVTEGSSLPGNATDGTLFRVVVAPKIYKGDTRTLATETETFWAQQVVIPATALPAAGAAPPNSGNDGDLFLVTDTAAPGGAGLYRRSGAPLNWYFIGPLSTWVDTGTGTSHSYYAGDVPNWLAASPTV